MHIRSLKCKQNKNARKRLIEDKNVVAFAQLMKIYLNSKFFCICIILLRFCIIIDTFLSICYTERADKYHFSKGNVS